MNALHVLVAHNDPMLRRLVVGSLSQDGARVSLASSSEDGLALLKRERIQVLVAGWDVFGVGDDFVRTVATIYPLMGVVLVFDNDRLDGAPQRASFSPVVYLSKPITSESLRVAVHKVVDRQTRHALGSRARQDSVPTFATACVEKQAGAGSIVAASKAMREVLSIVRRCAATDVPVLICGEPDTGKESIAAEIHRQSQRAGPLVRVACGALPEADLAERLFGRRQRGSERGDSAPPSLLEQARGGTLFLQNVSQLPLWGQVELLNALQQGSTSCVESQANRPESVRVVASTTTDLLTAATQHGFSPSLYYYLSVVQISVPPLRHRPQDIRPLVEANLAIANSMRARQGATSPCHFAEDAWKCLVEYDWPGNILQLASVVSRTVLLSDDEEISRAKLTESLGDITPQCDTDHISVPLLGDLKKIERAVIEAVIERCRGNKAAAARALGLHRRTLYRILQDEGPAKENATPLTFALDPNLASPTGAYS